MLFTCVLVVGTIQFSIYWGGRIRHRAFLALAERSVVLVDAIKAYEDKYGAPPASLEALVPDFIPSIPKTGMGAYPKYRYVVPEQDRYAGNPWVLFVFTPTGIPNFDQFIYYPLQNYPADLDGNPLERIRDWAYMHE